MNLLSDMGLVVSLGLAFIVLFRSRRRPMDYTLVGGCGIGAASFLGLRHGEPVVILGQAISTAMLLMLGLRVRTGRISRTDRRSMVGHDARRWMGVLQWLQIGSAIGAMYLWFVGGSSLHWLGFVVIALCVVLVGTEALLRRKSMFDGALSRPARP